MSGPNVPFHAMGGCRPGVSEVVGERGEVVVLARPTLAKVAAI